MADAAADLVDLAFPVQGRTIARDHRWLLAQALAERLPWLVDEPLAAVHPVNSVHGNGASALLSARARLRLRLPRHRAGAAAALAGAELRIGDDTLRLGAPTLRELMPHTTLYAHFVDAETPDEAAFLQEVHRQLERLQTTAHCVCGRAGVVSGPAGPLHGYSLMLHGLRAGASLRVQQAGLGAHRLLGCGMFVPHKSAAAVGD